MTDAKLRVAGDAITFVGARPVDAFFTKDLASAGLSGGLGVVLYLPTPGVVVESYLSGIGLMYLCELYSDLGTLYAWLWAAEVASAP